MSAVNVLYLCIYYVCIVKKKKTRRGKLIKLSVFKTLTCDNPSDKSLRFLIVVT